VNERIHKLAEESGMTQYVAADNKYLERFAELIIEEAAKAPLCDSDGVVGKYSDSDRYYFETLMKKQLGLK
jgi:hypothetical protein